MSALFNKEIASFLSWSLNYQHEYKLLGVTLNMQVCSLLCNEALLHAFWVLRLPSVDLQSMVFPCHQPFSVVSCNMHLTYFTALLLSNLLLLMSSGKPGDEIWLCVLKKTNKTITKRGLHKFWTGLLGVKCIGFIA